MSQNLYAKARQIAQDAVNADDNQNHQEAYRLYLQSAEILIELTKFTENPQLTKMYENRAKEYIGRAKALNKKTKNVCSFHSCGCSNPCLSSMSTQSIWSENNQNPSYPHNF